MHLKSLIKNICLFCDKYFEYEKVHKVKVTNQLKISKNFKTLFMILLISFNLFVSHIFFLNLIHSKMNESNDKITVAILRALKNMSMWFGI